MQLVETATGDLGHMFFHEQLDVQLNAEVTDRHHWVNCGRADRQTQLTFRNLAQDVLGTEPD